MRKFAVILGALILSVTFFVTACGDDEASGCDGCVDDYCDCIKGVDETDIEGALECFDDVVKCLEKEECSEDDFDENESC